MNAYSLVQIVTTRLPGYDQSEYLREVNAGYTELYNEILKLDDSYFEDIQTVTVNTQSTTFDLLFNKNGNLNAAVSMRLYQVSRVRINPPNLANWLDCNPAHWNLTELLAQQQQVNPPPQVITVGPVYYIIFGKGTLLFQRPLAVGTQIEVTFTSYKLDMSILTAGTVSSAGTAVTGSGTSFTQLIPPDFQAFLPTADIQVSIGAELIASGLTYRSATITDDTHLTLAVAPNPALSAAGYILASAPDDIPTQHHITIANIATRNMLTTPAEDDRFQAWAALADREIQLVKDTVMVRQTQKAPRVQRFPYGAVRRGRFFGPS